MTYTNSFTRETSSGKVRKIMSFSGLYNPKFPGRLYWPLWWPKGKEEFFVTEAYYRRTKILPSFDAAQGNALTIKLFDMDGTDRSQLVDCYPEADVVTLSVETSMYRCVVCADFGLDLFSAYLDVPGLIAWEYDIILIGTKLSF